MACNPEWQEQAPQVVQYGQVGCHSRAPASSDSVLYGMLDHDEMPLHSSIRLLCGIITEKVFIGATAE